MYDVASNEDLWMTQCTFNSEYRAIGPPLPTARQRNILLWPIGLYQSPASYITNSNGWRRLFNLLISAILSHDNSKD